MLTAFPLRFDYLSFWQAGILYVMLAIPVLWLGSQSMSVWDPFRKWASIGLRLDLLMLLVLLLAGAQWVEPIKDLSVIVVRDVSRSIENVKSDNPDGVRGDISDYLVAQQRRKPVDDRVGEISFDGMPWADAIPNAQLNVGTSAQRKPVDGTDIGSAIQLALAMMPQDTMHRIVLFSDGNATMGDWDQAVKSAASLHVPIDVVPLRYEIQHDISIEKFIAPATKMEGAPLTLDVVMRSQNPEPVRGRLTISDNGVPLILDRQGSEPKVSREVLLNPGANVEHVRLPAQASGTHDFQAVISPVGTETIDTIIQNDAAEAITFVRGRSKILYVEGPHTDPGAPLRQTLVQQGIDVKECDPSAVPSSLPQLQQYDAVVLVNVPMAFGGLDRSQAATLDTYVRELGGGLIVVGGPDSFGAGGWIGSKLEGLLPVDCQPPSAQVMPAGALLIVIDRSGSMGESLGNADQSKEQAANESAILALRALSSEDQVGVIAFDSEPAWVVPLGANHHLESTAVAIREIRPGGGTEIYPALEAANDAMSRLSPHEVPVRHVLLLTDGYSEGGDFDRLISQMASRGITLSTVGVGNDIDETLLKKFAHLGRGRFYRVADSRILPKIFVKEAMTLRSTLIREGPFQPRLRSSMNSLVLGIDKVPTLRGMIRTWRKSSPNVEVPIVSDAGEPILANWRVGLGQVAAFTSDAENRWAGDWVSSPLFGKFWTQVVRGTARSDESNAVEAHISPAESGKLQLIVETGQPGGAQDFSAMSAEVFGLDSDQPARSINLTRTGTNTFEGQFDAPDQGAYLAMISSAGNNSAPGWTAVPYVVDGSAEWHDLKSSEPVLRNIAARTGGRFIEPFDPDVNLFDRSDLQPASTSLPLTEQLLVLSMLTLLLDVAVRRIAWDRHSIAAMSHSFGDLVRSYTQVRVPAGQVAITALRTTRESANVRPQVERGLSVSAIHPVQSQYLPPRAAAAKIADPPLKAPGLQPHPSIELNPFERLADAKRRARQKTDT